MFIAQHSKNDGASGHIVDNCEGKENAVVCFLVEFSPVPGRKFKDPHWLILLRFVNG